MHFPLVVIFINSHKFLLIIEDETDFGLSAFNFTPSRASRQHACQVSFAVSRLGGHEKVAEVTHGLPVIILCKTS